ncbi:MiaB/RimO family radical SAM methylthiotransferase [bacterium]|nr:MiaB/RimO family radical SAM methylthiotransferase [bacterium]
MLKVSIKTYGCKVNQYESQLLRENIENCGYLVSDFNSSNIVLINSCCVTEKAESELRKFVQKSVNKGKKIWLTGCAVKKSNQFISMSGVEVFDDKETLLNSKLAGLNIITKFHNRTRAFVKIEDGCENFCAYCIVPYVRGPVRSRKEEDILCEVKHLVDNGYKEIVLTGVDLGAYGRDTGKELIGLLESLSRIEGLERIRISSLEVVYLNDKVIEYLSTNRLVCTHLHIPLQSGSDNILALMRRRYTFSDYIERVALARKKIDGVTFTTDAMVGFPGETEDDFISTCETIEKIGFLKVHIFRYSKRRETLAYRLENHISESVKREREKALCELSEKISNRTKERFIGSFLDVLVEKKKGENVFGYSSNYIPVFFSEKRIANNRVVTVKAERLIDGKLFCVKV